MIDKSGKNSTGRCHYNYDIAICTKFWDTFHILNAQHFSDDDEKSLVN